MAVFLFENEVQRYFELAPGESADEVLKVGRLVQISEIPRFLKSNSKLNYIKILHNLYFMILV